MIKESTTNHSEFIRFWNRRSRQSSPFCGVSWPICRQCQDERLSHLSSRHQDRALPITNSLRQWLVGDAPFRLKCALKLTHPPFEKRRLRQVSACNVSTVRDSEKSSIGGDQSQTIYVITVAWYWCVHKRFPCTCTCILYCCSSVVSLFFVFDAMQSGGCRDVISGGRDVEGVGGVSPSIKFWIWGLSPMILCRCKYWWCVKTVSNPYDGPSPLATCLCLVLKVTCNVSTRMC